jgi:two-component system sensor histidine kinase KdpD
MMGSGMAPAPSTARGLLVGAATTALALAVLLPLRHEIDTATAGLVLVLPGVAAALAGGRVAAIVTAAGAALAFDLGFLRPYGAFSVSVAEEAITLATLVLVAVACGSLVAREGERRAAAERRDAEVVAIRAEQAALEAQAMASSMASEHRAALLRAVSHDLRTPLSTIRAVASDLREGGGSYDATTRDELLDLVVDEVERLDRLVANLLSLSRVQAGALEADRTAVALDELFDACVRRHARLVRDRTVSIDVPLTLPLVDADWTLVEQAVTNLVANAVRHAPSGSRIWLSARQLDAGWVQVSVTDQGPGIDQALRDRLFEPFERGPGSTSSGVGLAIVRAVVDAHGGTITIDDVEGEDGGAAVRFTLPVRHG